VDATRKFSEAESGMARKWWNITGDAYAVLDVTCQREQTNLERAAGLSCIRFVD
jgi:hypothetical protein